MSVVPDAGNRPNLVCVCLLKNEYETNHALQLPRPVLRAIAAMQLFAEQSITRKNSNHGQSQEK